MSLPSRPEPKAPGPLPLACGVLFVLLPAFVFGAFLIYSGGVDVTLACRRTAPGTVTVQLDYKHLWGRSESREAYEGVRFASPWARTDNRGGSKAHTERGIRLLDAQGREHLIPRWDAIPLDEQGALIERMNGFIRGAPEDSFTSSYRTRGFSYWLGLFVCAVSFALILNGLRLLFLGPKTP